MPEDFVTYTSATYVTPGEYNLTLHKGENTGLAIIPSDESLVEVKSANAVNFPGKATLYLTHYDSVGRYDIAKYVVSDTAEKAPSVKVTAYTQTLKITLSSEAAFESYVYTVSDSKGNIVGCVQTEKTSYTLKNLSSAEKYVVSVKGINGKKHSASSSVTAVTKPYQVTGVTMTYTDGGAQINWEQVANCVGYLAYGYNSEDDKYVKIGQVSAAESSCMISEDKLIYDSYCVRAYSKNGTKSVYGEYSEYVTPSSKLATPKKLEVKDVTATGYTLSWGSVTGAKTYIIYVMQNGKWQELTEVSTNSYKAAFLEPGTEKIYCITAVSGKDTSQKSDAIYALTAPEAVNGFEAQDVTSSTITLSWDKTEGAVQYNLYICENGEYTLYDEYTGLSCSLTSLSQFTEYKFRIAAVAKGEKNSVIGSMSEEMAVVTLPEKVRDLIPVSIKDKSVTLSWAANEKADTYTVYVYDSSTGKYKEVGSTAETQFVVTSLKMTTEYKFCVSCSGTINSNVYTSEMSAPVRVITSYSVPEGFTLSSIKSSSYKLSWNEIPQAESYNVYRKKGKTYELVKNTAANSYSVKGLSYGTVDTYKVSAVYSKNKDTVESELSAEVKASTLPSKVAGLSVTVYTQTAKLQWEKTPNATHYDVFIYEDGEYVLQDTVENNTCKLTGLCEGTSYKFAVRAVIKLDSGTAAGSKATVSAVMKPAKVKKVSLSSVTATKQKISWSAAVGANYYYVYRYSSKSGGYVKVAETASRSYTFSSLKAGTTYSYRVYSAVVKDGKEIVKGDKSATYKFSTDPDKVKGLKSTSVTASKVALSWSSVKSATFYEVLYYSKDLGSYVLAGTTEKTSFTVKKLSSSTEYKFKVRAVRTLNSKEYTGSYSSVLTVKTK